METTIQAKVHYPFPTQVNPHADAIIDELNRWIDESYLFLPAAFKEKLRMANLGYLAACFWPAATFEKLVPMARWLLWTLANDDFYGPFPADKLRVICNRQIAILNGAALVPQDNEIFRQLAISRQELLPHVTAPWLDRFVRNNVYYLEAMLQETFHSYQQHVNYLSLKEYIPFREKISAVDAVSDLAEIAVDFIIPSHIFIHPVIQHIKQLANHLVCYSNDIYSVEKDLRTHEATNLVLVIQHEQHCTLASAYEKAVHIHNTDLEAFIRLSAALPDFAPFNEAVKKYIFNVGLMLQGHLHWYSKNTRYD